MCSPASDCWSFLGFRWNQSQKSYTRNLFAFVLVTNRLLLLPGRPLGTLLVCKHSPTTFQVILGDVCPQDKSFNQYISKAAAHTSKEICWKDCLWMLCHQVKFASNFSLWLSIAAYSNHLTSRWEMHTFSSDQWLLVFRPLWLVTLQPVPQQQLATSSNQSPTSQGMHSFP